jgi:hypothetical protein
MRSCTLQINDRGTVQAWTTGHYGGNNDNDMITTLMQQCEKKRFRLILTTTQHNEDAGMRENVLHRQRRQQHTKGLAVAGLEKGDLFVLRKTVCFPLRKAFSSF